MIKPFFHAIGLAGLLVSASPVAGHASSQERADGKPSCTISDSEIAGVASATRDPNRQGVTGPVDAPKLLPLEERTRKAVFSDINKARAKARVEAEAEYPRPTSSSLVTPSRVGKADRYKAASELALLALEARYVAEIQRRYGLGCAEVRQIFREGQLKKWPVA